MIVDQHISSVNEIIHKEYLRGILSVIFMEGVTEGSGITIKEIVDKGIDTIIKEMEHNTGLKYKSE